MTDQPYLQAGIAVVGFDYTRVAADSNAKTGAFWDIYNGRDIGTKKPSYLPTYLPTLVIYSEITPKTNPPHRRPHSMGMGLPPRARRPQRHRPRDRQRPRRRNRVLAPRQSGSRRRAAGQAHHADHAHEQRRPGARPVPVPRAERAGRDAREQQERRGVVDGQYPGDLRQPRGESAV